MDTPAQAEVLLTAADTDSLGMILTSFPFAAAGDRRVHTAVREALPTLRLTRRQLTKQIDSARQRIAAGELRHEADSIRAESQPSME